MLVIGYFVVGVGIFVFPQSLHILLMYVSDDVVLVFRVLGMGDGSFYSLT